MTRARTEGDGPKRGGTEGDGRVRRRLATMRRVQDIALSMFEAQGLTEVSVEDVAARAHVGAASVYRNFGSKEGLVLWDDYDPALLKGIRARLGAQPPLLAVRDAVLEALAQVYTRDRERILRRSRLMLAEPTLIAANAAQQEAFRSELVATFQRAHRHMEAHVLGSVCLGLLDASVREWTRKSGRVSMARVVDAVFALVSVQTSGQTKHGYP